MANDAKAQKPSIHFIPGTPLLLESCRISPDAGQPGLYLNWRNLDPRALERAAVTVYCYDGDGKLLAFSSHEYTDLSVPQGAAFGEDRLIPCQPDQPCRVEAELHSIAFHQDIVWQPQEEAWFSIVPAPAPSAPPPVEDAAEETIGEAAKEETNDMPDPPAAPGEAAAAPARPRRRRAWMLISCGLLLAAALFCTVYFYLIPEKNYRSAQALLARGDYDAASQAFRETGDYKDAPEMVLGVYYAEAEALLSRGDREGAITAFAKAGDYTNAADRIDAIQYQQAETLLSQGQEEAAFTLFSSIPHYRDAAQRARSIRLDQAERALNAGDYAAAAAIHAALGGDEYAPIYAHAQALFLKGLYEQAAAAWQFIPDYQDSREQIYQCALSASQAQDYALSIRLFTYLQDYRDSGARITADTYSQGLMLLNNGKNQEALEIFLALGAYEDAAAMALEARYRMASADLEAGSYAQAKATFLALADYKDSALMALEADYRLAIHSCTAGDYAAAISLFTALSDYKDSADRLIRARYDQACKQLSDGDFDSAVAAFISLDGYLNSGEMLLSAYYGKGLSLSAQGELSAAYDYFLLAQNYQDAPQLALDHAFQYALQLQALEQYEDALAWYALAGDHPQIPHQKFLIGEAYFARQSYDEALALLKECREIEGAAEYLYLIGQYFEGVQLPVRAYAAYAYAGDYQDSAARRIALTEYMQSLAGQALQQGHYQEADLMYETLAMGGIVTEESLQAEFFAFLTQPGRKITLGAFPQSAGGAAQPVIWQVVDSTDGIATLLAHQPLTCAQYDTRSAYSVEDALSALSDMFTGREKASVGNCYLLTQREIKKYLPNAQDRITRPTEYAAAQSIEGGTYRTEGVWTADQADDFNYVIYHPMTGAIGQKSLNFKTNYVRPAAQLMLNEALYQLLGDPMNGYQFYDAHGNAVFFQSRYQ